MFLRKKEVKGVLYWSIMESYRDGRKVKQRNIQSLGSTDNAWEILRESNEYSQFLDQLKPYRNGGIEVQEEARVLDACCGSRKFWFDKQNDDVVYMDKRQLQDTLCDGRTLTVNPDVIADFRSMPFRDNSFYMVVFDPPHLLKAGDESWLAKKYGRLGPVWKEDIKQGVNECMRVLKPNGTHIFKWNEDQISITEILKAIDHKPLFGR